MATLSPTDRTLTLAGVVAGVIAMPWLPGPLLPDAPRLATVALAFLLPTMALIASATQARLTAHGHADDEPFRASTGAIASATTVLCSLALSLHVLVLLTVTSGVNAGTLPARAAVVLFGLHVVAAGNAVPRLRPGAPAGIALSLADIRRHTWMRISRAVGRVCVVAGIVVAMAGTTLSGPRIDDVLKATLVSATVYLGWSLRRAWAA